MMLFVDVFVLIRLSGLPLVALRSTSSGVEFFRSKPEPYRKPYIGLCKSNFKGVDNNISLSGPPGRRKLKIDFFLTGTFYDVSTSKNMLKFIFNVENNFFPLKMIKNNRSVK